MKTEVLMKRQLFGCDILQSSKNEFFSATDLVDAGNKWRKENGNPNPFKMATWLQSQSVKEFINSLGKRFGVVKINSKGKNSHTWVHPYLFIDIALAISPDLKIEVYSWIYDHLIKYRNESGDSYKKMCGAIYEKYPNKTQFPKFIISVADKIKDGMGLASWQEATENQLKIRDKIHENIALLADILPCEDAIRIGIKKALED